jgi:hypothetical protein
VTKVNFCYLRRHKKVTAVGLTLPTDCRWLRTHNGLAGHYPCCFLQTSSLIRTHRHYLLTAHYHSGRRDRHWLRRSESSSRGLPSSKAAPDRLVDPANACCLSKIAARKTASILCDRQKRRLTCINLFGFLRWNALRSGRATSGCRSPCEFIAEQAPIAQGRLWPASRSASDEVAIVCPAPDNCCRGGGATHRTVDGWDRTTQILEPFRMRVCRRWRD